MRYAAAPTPATPSSCPYTTAGFLVFFDWDSAVVGPSGREVIGLAAQTYKAGSPVTVQVTGFTDTSGSADYNQRLSVRRADAVAAILAQDGVPSGSMVVTGRGQNDLRVPTPDGVREPQNRRVEIVEGGGPPPTSMRSSGRTKGRRWRPSHAGETTGRRLDLFIG
jgi:outer membrane protein OmpA-like peptidoglycan-associated protein